MSTNAKNRADTELPRETDELVLATRGGGVAVDARSQGASCLSLCYAGAIVTSVSQEIDATKVLRS